MIDLNVFIIIAVAAVLSTVGILAWIVDGGVADKYQAPIKYGLFLLFAAVIGLFFMIEDDSEFAFKGIEVEEKNGEDKRQKAMDIANGKPGKTTYVAADENNGAGGPGEVAIEEGQKKGSIDDCPECPEIVEIATGVALLGSPLAVVSGTAQTGPPDQVTITRSFGIGRYEVKVKEFAAFIAETGHKPAAECMFAGTKRAVGGYGNVGFAQEDDDPVTCVSWRDAGAYADWLTQKTGNRYRLPTEAEWEYAARAGVTTAYVTGAIITGKDANFADKLGGKRSRTAKAGSYKPNAFGLYDVHGNVWEMVADCWSPAYRSADVRRPQVSGEDCTRKIAKGGAWFSPPEQVNLAMRVAIETGTASNGLGFRVVREIQQTAADDKGAAAEALSAN